MCPSRTPWVSPMNSPVRLGVSPAASPATTGVYSQRFEALFPRWSPGLWACLAPQLFLPVYLYMNVGPPVLQPPPHLRVLCTQLPISAPPAGLGECFFFNSLVVGLPYSSIFWKFWAFFVLRLLVILLVVVQGGKACLLTPPS